MRESVNLSRYSLTLWLRDLWTLPWLLSWTSLQPLSIPMDVRALDGRSVGRVTHNTTPINLRVSGTHSESIKFLLIKSSQAPVVLGLSWLQRHNPLIDWSAGAIISWNLICQAHCLKSAWPAPGCLPEGLEVAPDLPTIPTEYQVFSKQQLFFHCTDPMTVFSQAPLRPVLSVLSVESGDQGYIEDSLAAVFIRPSVYLAGAGFFFVQKKDKTLLPCIDYRGLNDITVKNRYLLQFIFSAFELLQQATMYSKLELWNAYNLVWIQEGDEW